MDPCGEAADLVVVRIDAEGRRHRLDRLLDAALSNGLLLPRDPGRRSTHHRAAA
jgi:hypothetical protein